MSKPVSSTTPGQRIKSLLSFRGRYRILYLTWFAFFLSFVVWFNFAPFSATIGEELRLSREQLITIGLCNVALTVPARVLIGMALDRWGPRRVFATILIYAVVPCTPFATASSFEMLVASRLALSVVGAGFVVGIRMVSEWFPPKEMGTAEGVYGGWGNFGSAAAAFTLPTLALVGASLGGWRMAIGTTGVLAAVYGAYYLRAVTDTPAGEAYARPKRQGALEVTSRTGVYGLLALNVPLLAILGLVAWRLQRVGFINGVTLAVVVITLGLILVVQSRGIVRAGRTSHRRADERRHGQPQEHPDGDPAGTGPWLRPHVVCRRQLAGGAGRPGCDVLLVLRPSRGGRDVRHRAPGEKARVRSDLRHRRCLRQCRRAVVPDLVAVRRAHRLLRHHRGVGNRGGRRLPLAGRT